MPLGRTGTAAEVGQAREVTSLALEASQVFRAFSPTQAGHVFIGEIVAHELAVGGNGSLNLREGQRHYARYPQVPFRTDRWDRALIIPTTSIHAPNICFMQFSASTAGDLTNLARQVFDGLQIDAERVYQPATGDVRDRARVDPLNRVWMVPACVLVLTWFMVLLSRKRDLLCYGLLGIDRARVGMVVAIEGLLLILCTLPAAFAIGGMASGLPGFRWWTVIGSDAIRLAAAGLICLPAVSVAAVPRADLQVL